jgi:hypothetical protein
VSDPPEEEVDMTTGIAEIVALLTVVAFVYVGVTGAATDTRGTGAGDALRGQVVIDCDGVLGPRPSLPPRGRSPLRGRCTVSGAISDRGKFVDDARLSVHPHVRTLFGRKGTIRMSVYLERGHWEIIGGTRAYAGLRGRGRESNSGRCGSSGLGCPISITMTGRVSQ